MERITLTHARRAALAGAVGALAMGTVTGTVVGTVTGAAAGLATGLTVAAGSLSAALATLRLKVTDPHR